MWNSSVSNGTSNQIFKKAARDENKPNTIIDVAGTKIGGGNFAVIAGPCSV
ncbi:MAG: 3-deoxy-7-phosphoheptulonate synthase, partial [[Eubacterium] sulci]|nr:3-deoxy-7-phosphoheptulonate synthase [[Eubacterium] sulci]